MTNLQEHQDKSSNQISPTWSEESARKKSEAFAAAFEQDCRVGVTS